MAHQLDAHKESISNCDVAICFNELFAASVYQWANRHQKRIGKDIHIIAFDGIYAHTFTPSLTTIDFDFKEMAKKTVELALSMVGNLEQWQLLRGQIQEIPSRLVVRSSSPI